ncbi:MAG: hypothetical protein U0R81_16215 [Mycobacterium sp.]
MFCALDLIANIAEDGEGVDFDVVTATGVQHWRYTLTDSGVLARTEKLTAHLAVAFPAQLDRQWVLEFLLDRGVDQTGLEPAGLFAEADTCQECGDSLAWCTYWLKRWPRLSAARDV